MFSSEAQSAYIALQSRILETQDNYTVERAERALDEIIRNPENTTPANHQVRSAWANAGKVLQNRREVAPQVHLDTPGLRLGVTDGDYDAVEVLDWLDHAAVSAPARLLLHSLAVGADAQMLAEAQGIPVQRVRERISRARRAGAADFYASVVAA